ncbi:Crp/Fnr family transcriptional regulator [Taklimakanibacter lacteus]|uniref:Crp/Fnr family transcriptional regulator n=1 Tax=Taklimakanibacter lacteus TaxID=2268456 RepID=UPI000E66E77C
MAQTVCMPSPTSLHEIDFLSALPHKEREKLAEQCTWHRLPPNQILIDGDPENPHGVFLLSEGVVELSRRDAGGDSVPMGWLCATACLGEFAAITNSPGTISIRTVTSCVFAELARETFIPLLSRYPAMSLSLLRKTISIVRALEDDIVRLHKADGVLATAHRKAILRSL